MPTEYIRGNTTNYIATILSFVAITLISCNKRQYYSNNKNIVISAFRQVLLLSDARTRRTTRLQW
jgi:hypothetical protein